jgi:hypothetical protein
MAKTEASSIVFALERPHLCMLYDEPLSKTETAQICIAHEPAN